MIQKLHVESQGTQYNTPSIKSSGEEGGEGEEKATIPHTGVIYHFTLNPASPAAAAAKSWLPSVGPPPAINPSGGGAGARRRVVCPTPPTPTTKLELQRRGGRVVDGGSVAGRARWCHRPPRVTTFARYANGNLKAVMPSVAAVIAAAPSVSLLSWAVWPIRALHGYTFENEVTLAPCLIMKISR